MVRSQRVDSSNRQISRMNAPGAESIASPMCAVHEYFDEITGLCGLCADICKIGQPNLAACIRHCPKIYEQLNNKGSTVSIRQMGAASSSVLTAAVPKSLATTSHSLSNHQPDYDGSTWIWILVSILIFLLIILAVVVFVIVKNKTKHPLSAEDKEEKMESMQMSAKPSMTCASSEFMSMGSSRQPDSHIRISHTSGYESAVIDFNSSPGPYSNAGLVIKQSRSSPINQSRNRTKEKDIPCSDAVLDSGGYLTPADDVQTDGVDECSSLCAAENLA